jgi:hypothetical protein
MDGRNRLFGSKKSVAHFSSVGALPIRANIKELISLLLGVVVASLVIHLN